MENESIFSISSVYSCGSIVWRMGTLRTEIQLSGFFLEGPGPCPFLSLHPSNSLYRFLFLAFLFTAFLFPPRILSLPLPQICFSPVHETSRCFVHFFLYLIASSSSFSFSFSFLLFLSPLSPSSPHPYPPPPPSPPPPPPPLSVNSSFLGSAPSWMG